MLVPAPGAGKVIHYLGGFVVCDTSGAIYEFNAAGANEAFIVARVENTDVSARITDTGFELGNLLGYESLTASHFLNAVASSVRL